MKMMIQLKSMSNPEIEKLKKDIVSTERILKIEQEELSKKLDEGWLDNMEEVLENNPDYFNEALQKMYPLPKQEEDIKPKKGFKKLFDKIKKIM